MAVPSDAEEQVWTSSRGGGSFTVSELETCMKVLAVLNDDRPLLQSPCFRELRQLGQVFNWTPHKRRPETPNSQNASIRAQRKKEDLEHVRKAALRQQRQAALEALMEPQTLMITAGDGSEATPGSNAILSLQFGETRAESGKTDGEPADAGDTAGPSVVADEQSAAVGTEGTPADLGTAGSAAADGTVEAESTDAAKLHYGRSCYICKKKYYDMHHFYDLLCPECAALNYLKRQQGGDLHGRVALLTGARVKIGYQCGLKLLRCGCEVIALTRFPHDAARRYAAEKDYDEWASRLHVYGLDMRDLPAVERFCDMVKDTYARLDFIVHNAAQTIRRPPAFYKHLMPYELLTHGDLTPEVARVVAPPSQWSAAPGVRQVEGAERLTESDGGSGKEEASDIAVTDMPSSSAALSQVPLVAGDAGVDHGALFPHGRLDQDEQQVDLRVRNSWVLKLHEVSTVELLEVHAINAMAPFVMNSRLKDMMERVPDVDKYIVNVSAMEGKFYRHKSVDHPHTNMAKAALNMMTRTSARDYATSRIFMNAVDTGWINDENPLEKVAAYHRNNNFATPIDEVDAMARILDPIFVGVNTGVNPFGLFYKDYRSTEW